MSYSFSKVLKEIHTENSEEQNETIANAFDEMGCMDMDYDILIWNVIQYAVKHNNARELLDGVFNHDEEKAIIYGILEPEGGTK